MQVRDRHDQVIAEEPTRKNRNMEWVRIERERKLTFVTGFDLHIAMKIRINSAHLCHPRLSPFTFDISNQEIK